MTIADHGIPQKIATAPTGTLLVANSFSCYEQIRQNTGRMPLDLAEVVQRALQASPTRH